MEGYVGVKFESTCISDEIPTEALDNIKQFNLVSELLKVNGMTYKNAGNISIRSQGGFLITGSGVYLDDIRLEDLVKVLNYDIEDFFLTYTGMKLPSAEAFLHGLIYDTRSDVKCIIHVHDPLTGEFDPSNVTTTPEEYDYGTSDLAKVCLNTLKSENIVFLRNHGYVAVGEGLDDALEKLMQCHTELVQKQVTAQE
jgi:L-fuculose-phosphate aldolase